MFVKTYEVEGEILLAACDEEIIGKTFNEGNLSIEVKEDFYRGEKTGLENLEDLIKEASIVNLTGNNVVEKAISSGLVDESNIITINGIKHAQIVEL